MFIVKYTCGMNFLCNVNIISIVTDSFKRRATFSCAMVKSGKIKIFPDRIFKDNNNTTALFNYIPYIGTFGKRKYVKILI